MQRKLHATLTAADFIPPTRSLSTLREAAGGCRGCPLYLRGTQTVFGEGPRRARIVLVGEQPGNDEDLAGRPFVGPAGRLLDRALGAAGIPREDAYLSNAVKHFKWTPKGKRRLHQRPSASEIEHCKPWLEAELALIRPEVLVCMGAVAAQALFGRAFRVTAQRGRPFAHELAESALATVHPASILRSRTSEEREQAFEQLCDDLRVAKRLLDKSARSRAG
jgi:DNA polymerase